MENLIELYTTLLNKINKIYIRDFYQDFFPKDRLTGIVGPRGVGKTTFLLYFLKNLNLPVDQTIYISMDHIFFAENKLLDTVDKLVKEFAIKVICIDEIHKYSNWNQELKNIYDFYPDLQVIFSGSSSVDLLKGRYDLSRRVVLKHMHGLSFKEYLEIKTGKKYPLFTFDEIMKGEHNDLSKIAIEEKLLGHFHDYLKVGYYPFFLENEDIGDYSQKILNIVNKIIFEDITSFYSLRTQNLDYLKKIIYFFSTTAPGSLSVNQLANSIGKDHSTISNYIQILRDTGLLKFLLVDKYGHAFVRNAEKIYLDNTNLLHSICSAVGKELNIGTVRETFLISTLQNSGHKVFYSKNGDVKCGDYVFEIGGKDKTMTQIKDVKNGYLVLDDILYRSGSKVPLYLFGFLKNLNLPSL